MKDYFEILDVSEDDGIQTIQEAYRLMSGKYPASQYPEKSRDIEEAYKVLSNPAAIGSCIDFHRMELSSKQAYAFAYDAINEGKYSAAAKILERALKCEEHATHLNYMLGIAYLKQKKASKAVKVLDLVRVKYPYDMDINILFIRACIEARKYSRALIWAEECYDFDKNNFTLINLLSEAYMKTKEFGEAAYVLNEAFNNPAFADKLCDTGTKLAYALFFDKKYTDSLNMMEKLTDLDINNEKWLGQWLGQWMSPVDVLIDILDRFIDLHMLPEAERCAGIISTLAPERQEIAEVKEGIEELLRIEPEIDRFDDDEFIPSLLKIYVASGISLAEMEGMSEEQCRAYELLLEYQILSEYDNCLIALRYMRNNYPELYSIKADFLDAVQDTRERKKLTNKSKALVYQYRDVISELLDKWDQDDNDDA